MLLSVILFAPVIVASSAKENPVLASARENNASDSKISYPLAVTRKSSVMTSPLVGSRGVQSTAPSMGSTVMVISVKSLRPKGAPRRSLALNIKSSALAVVVVCL